MSNRDDGGPAFPQLAVEACERDGHGDLIEPFTSAVGGMSMRDWFAGQALIGLLSGRNGGCHHKADAECSYALADAMLAERSKR